MADDEPFNISALLGIMRVLGLKNADELVDTCYNGQNLVDYVEKAVEEDDFQRYSLILTDCQMPIMDGYEAINQVRELLDDKVQEVKIIAITGHVEAEYLKKAKDCGINQVYAKPFPVGELALILQDLNFI